jgi:hypothetical protein
MDRTLGVLEYQGAHPLYMFVCVYVCYTSIHRKLDPGRRCPRRPASHCIQGGTVIRRDQSVVEKDASTSKQQKEWNAQGGANDADEPRAAQDAERRAQELGAAMLNAARPYVDVKLSKAGYPLPIQPCDFFACLENHTACY